MAYRVVRVRPHPNFSGTPPVVTAMVVRKLKTEQRKLRKAAAQGQKEIPKARQRAQKTRKRVASLSTRASAEPRPEKKQAIQTQVATESAKADQLEAQVESFEDKVTELLAAADSEIGTILVDDSLHEVHIPSERLTDTVYLAPSEGEAPDTSELVVQSDSGTLPVVEG